MLEFSCFISNLNKHSSPSLILVTAPMETPLFSCLFSLLICSILLSAVRIDAGSGQCLSHQQSLLLQLKNELLPNAPTSNKFRKWSQNSDCCSWEGVTCKEGHVTGLDLSSQGISVGIENSTLFNLQSLESLDLSYNNFNSTIPARVGNLTSLNYLNLANAGFMGQIPIDISHLTSLITLDLSTEGNMKLEKPSLFMLIQNLTKLEELYLDGVNMSSSPVPLYLANVSNLVSLSLCARELYGEFPKEIFKVRTLQTLQISGNELLQGSLPEFPQNSALQTLMLGYTNFSGPLPTSIDNLRNLSILNLSKCQFTGTLPNSMIKLTKLVYLDLSVNKFTGPVPSFKMSKNLRKIILSHNDLNGEIPISIFNLRNLKLLSLSSNKLNGTIELDIIQGLPNLTYLDLSHNSLIVKTSGSHFNLSTFPYIRTLKLSSCKLRQFPNLKNQSKLVELDLSNNQLHGEVPNWIWEVGNGSLRYLNLCHNFLVGIQEPYSPPSDMFFLDLHLNQLQGKIPILPPSASYIDFSSNNFTSIPSSIGYNLSSTHFFSLSNNFIMGAIPESICMARNLEVLELSKNSLNGKVPECMFTANKALRVLSLQNNNLSGPIPNTFLGKCSLKTLDLNGNMIEGQIPKSLANCNQLEVLNLGNNNLIDEFPCLLMNISSLQVLVLRSNKLYGSIECLNASVTWAMLQIFDLAHNNFSGKLPGQSFANWKAMMGGEGNNTQRKLNFLQFRLITLSKTDYRDTVTITGKGIEMNLVKILTIYTSIDLSSNKFNGSIPKEIGELTSLYILDLSSNSLSGKMPMSLGNLQSVESLDLSRNHLTGNIPPSLTKLNFLSYLNLSFNQLVGNIPSGNQIQTFSADSFMGNEGLCGPPLIHNCTNGVAKPNANYSYEGSGIDWDFLSAEIGFIVGFGMLVGPLVFCRRWRKWYFQGVDEIAFKICPLFLWRFYYRKFANQNKGWRH